MFENLAVGISVRLQDSASPGLQRLGRLLANVAEKMDRGTARARNFAANLRGNLSSAVDNVSRKFRRLRHGMNSMAQGFHEARMAMVIFTAGVGVSVAAAAKFENQMAVVRSVLGLSIADTKELENEMKRLGATTVFTATEAAEGAEKLGRAGFSMRETMAALPGVLNMAAAEGMDLARASTIASNTLRQFNLDASESDRVADVLAQTSRKTNTSIEQLGQGLKFAAPFASTLGISLEDTSLALGVLANRGLVAEMGGTSFRNMLIRMTSATRTTKAAFAELGFAVTDEDFKDMGGLFEKLSIVLGKIPTKTERAAFVAKAFGVRGMNAAVGMADAFTDMNKRLTETGSSWSDLTKSIHNATGVAQEMASVRLDSMIGALTLLKSAMEGLAIEVWLPFLRATGPMVRVIANAVQAVVAGVAKWESPIVTMKDEMSKLSLGAHRLFFRIGQGMGRGVDDLINFTKRIRDLVQSFFNAVRPTNEFLNGIGRFVVLGAVAGAALTALSLVMLVTVVPAVNMLSASFAILEAILGVGIAPAIGIALAVLGVFAVYLRSSAAEGQTMKERFFEVWDSMRHFAVTFGRGFAEVWNEFLQPTFAFLWYAFMELVDAVWAAFEPLEYFFSSGAEDGEFFGVAAGGGIGIVNLALAELLLILAGITSFFTDNFIGPILTGFVQIIGGLLDMQSGATSFNDAVIRMSKGLTNLLLNSVLVPLKWILQATVAAAEAFGLLSEKEAKRLQDTLNAKPGTLLGEKEREATKHHRASKDALYQYKKEKEARNKDPSLFGELTNKLTAKLKTDICIDGKKVNAATAEQQIELAERGGFELTNPWQRSQVSVHGMPA